MQMEINKQIKFLCCGSLLFLYIICGALGIYMVIFSAKGKREHSLRIYQTAIDEWDTLQRTQFQNLALTVQKDGESSNQFVAWEDEEHIRVLDHDQYGKLPTYNPMMYHLLQDGSEFGFNDSYDTFNTSIKFDFDLEIEDGGEVSTIGFTDVPVFKLNATHHSGPRSCTRKGNYYSYESNECVEYSIFSGFCVKVSKTDDKWALNDTFGGYDCTGGSHHSSPFKYDRIRIEDGNTIDHHLPIEIGTIKADVRSGHDPYFYVERLTSETNNFGMDSRTMFVLGVIILFICCVLSIQPLYMIYNFNKKGPLRFDTFEDVDVQIPERVVEPKQEINEEDLEKKQKGPEFRRRF